MKAHLVIGCLLCVLIFLQISKAYSIFDTRLTMFDIVERTNIAIKYNGGYFLAYSIQNSGYWFIEFRSLSVSGNPLSCHKFGCYNNHHTYTYSMASTLDSCAIAVGKRQIGCTQSTYVGYAIKVDSALSMVWEREIPGSAQIYGIEIKNRIFMTGYTASSTGFAAIINSDSSIASSTPIEVINIPSYCFGAVTVDTSHFIAGYATTDSGDEQCLFVKVNDFPTIDAIGYYGSDIVSDKCYGISTSPQGDLYMVGVRNYVSGPRAYVYWISKYNYMKSGKEYGTDYARFDKIVQMGDETHSILGFSKPAGQNGRIWVMNIDSDLGAGYEFYDPGSTDSNYRDNVGISIIYITDRIVAFTGDYCYVDGENDIWIRVLDLSCKKGHYLANSYTCSKCPYGKYQDVDNQSACKDCTLGTYTPNTGSIQCADCPIGSQCPNPTQAVACQPGYYQPNARSLSCIQCPPWEYQHNYGASQCNPCGLKHFFNIDKCECCAPGTYSDVYNATSCKLAPAGTYVPFKDSSTFTVCKAGFYQPSEGQSECLECTPGTFQDQTKSTICKPCDYGQYAPNKQSLSCLLCPVGHYQNETGKSECKACPTGSYTNSQGTITCTLCKKNEFQNETGKTFCYTCDPGFYQDQEGQSECLRILIF